MGAGIFHLFRQPFILGIIFGLAIALLIAVYTVPIWIWWDFKVAG
jgi:hypothetical protein